MHLSTLRWHRDHRTSPRYFETFTIYIISSLEIYHHISLHWRKTSLTEHDSFLLLLLLVEVVVEGWHQVSRCCTCFQARARPPNHICTQLKFKIRCCCTITSLQLAVTNGRKSHRPKGFSNGTVAEDCRPSAPRPELGFISFCNVCR